MIRRLAASAAYAGAAVLVVVGYAATAASTALHRWASDQTPRRARPRSDLDDYLRGTTAPGGRA